MSVDLQWETLTAGPEGDARAESIRSFIHDKFQLVPFPKFIKSVEVRSFSFGTIAPDIEIKTICDPYPEFYEQDEEDDSDSDSADEHDKEYLLKLERKTEERESVATGTPSTSTQPPPYSVEGTRSGRRRKHLNLHYFHSALSFNNGAPTPFQQSSVSTPSRLQTFTTPSHDSYPSPPSPADPGPADHLSTLSLKDTESPHGTFADDTNSSLQRQLTRLREPRDADTQIIARVRYAGDVRVEITCELLFEYPVTNFVALPVKLVITGCTFDGLACVAYIRRRAHFCFLDEDPEEEGVRGKAASLLKQINVESEIGEKGKGKQVLKNVGKVERFVLEQVRRIFEEEFVFPSSWTFLV